MPNHAASAGQRDVALLGTLFSVLWLLHWDQLFPRPVACVVYWCRITRLPSWCEPVPSKWVWTSAGSHFTSKAGWSLALAEAQPHHLSLLCPYHCLQGSVQLSSLEDAPCVERCSWPARAGFSAAGGCRASGQLRSIHDLLNGDALGWDWHKEAILPTPHPVCVPFKSMYISLSLQRCLRPFFLTILNSPEGC